MKPPRFFSPTEDWQFLAERECAVFDIGIMLVSRKWHLLGWALGVFRRQIQRQGISS